MKQGKVMQTKSNLLLEISNYYSDKIFQFGCTPNGVDWNGKESQFTRFNQLLKICEQDDLFSLGDFGCGYGALLEYLSSKPKVTKYFGYDVSELMIENALKIKAPEISAVFSTNKAGLKGLDYVVASGVFNVRLKAKEMEWIEYIKETLCLINESASKGFSFNALTSYSDKEKMKDYLYYSDPLFWFDYCKRNFSKQVALLHDYKLYEFTILVRK